PSTAANARLAQVISILSILFNGSRRLVYEPIQEYLCIFSMMDGYNIHHYYSLKSKTHSQQLKNYFSI
ncbi:MAG: hypothetical protein II855_01250, partial [Candidatus Methanomethylophilaceae archaeon]|nr:hypothetical protein [Candidatus Methanomethylophilaceae archaeon]